MATLVRTLPLLAQVGVGGYSIATICIVVVIIAACIGLVIIATRQFGIPIPPWFWQVLSIVAVAFIVILAIKFVASM